MKALLSVILPIFLSGCASTVKGTIDGVSKPGDLVPQPWPDAPPQSSTVPDYPK